MFFAVKLFKVGLSFIASKSKKQKKDSKHV